MIIQPELFWHTNVATICLDPAGDDEKALYNYPSSFAILDDSYFVKWKQLGKNPFITMHVKADGSRKNSYESRPKIRKILPNRPSHVCSQSERSYPFFLMASASAGCSR